MSEGVVAAGSVPYTRTHGVWASQLGDYEGIEPIEQRTLQEMKHPIRRILNKNGHLSDPSKWTYGPFHDLDLLRKWWSTPRATVEEGRRVYHNTDPMTNLPMDFHQYEEVEVLDDANRFDMDPGNRGDRNYADKTRLALEAGRRGGIPMFQFYMHHCLPSLAGFRRMMAFYSFQQNPLLMENPVREWEREYWRAHPPMRGLLSENFRVNPAVYSSASHSLVSQAERDAEYHAFRMKMVSKIATTFGTPEFYYVRQYWLQHGINALSEHQDVVDAFNEASASIGKEDGINASVFRHVRSVEDWPRDEYAYDSDGGRGRERASHSEALEEDDTSGLLDVLDELDLSFNELEDRRGAARSSRGSHS